ncbi:hypothetical protein ACOSP7_016955 [Xanthoceras sorbifolium]
MEDSDCCKDKATIRPSHHRTSTHLKASLEHRSINIHAKFALLAPVSVFWEESFPSWLVGLLDSVVLS